MKTYTVFDTDEGRYFTVRASSLVNAQRKALNFLGYELRDPQPDELLLPDDNQEMKLIPWTEKSKRVYYPHPGML